MEPGDLVRECIRDKGFYGGTTDGRSIAEPYKLEQLPGGVTFFGDECLLQMERLIPVCEAFHREDVHIAVETCLFAPAT